MKTLHMCVRFFGTIQYVGKSECTHSDRGSFYYRIWILGCALCVHMTIDNYEDVEDFTRLDYISQ